MTVELIPESFERQVRDCLAHLYDFTVLISNPLASQIAPDLTGLQRVQTVRRVLIETIEQLKARETVGIPTRQDRIYSLLSMRYVEGLPVPEVLQQLVLSERQFYREDHRAVQSVSHLLWDRLKASQTQDSEISVRSEIQRFSRQSPYAIIDIESLLSGAIEAIAKLAEHYRVTMHLRPRQAFGDFIAHEAVLRQTVIWMLSQIITQVAEGSFISLNTSTNDDNPAIDFEISAPDADIRVLHEILTNNPTAAEFLATLNGTIKASEVDRGSILVQLELQRQRCVVLVIDDNPDAVALLGRYVTGMPYEIASAYSADEGFRLLQHLEPSCIVLDILLPQTDGWKILQELKRHPRTKRVPIVVCSALDNPNLALSLGADAYLRKPPDRVSFLEALARWTATEH